MCAEHLPLENHPEIAAAIAIGSIPIYAFTLYLADLRGQSLLLLSISGMLLLLSSLIFGMIFGQLKAETKQEGVRMEENLREFLEAAKTEGEPATMEDFVEAFKRVQDDE